MKAQLISLNPPLPVLQRNAFDRFTGACLYSKLALQFPSNFWDQRSETLHFVSNVTRGYHAALLNLDHPSYEPGSTALVFEMTGDQARQLEAEPLEIR